VLEALRPTPPDQRTGERLLAALDRLRKDSPVKLPAQGPVRLLLGQASYTQAVTWIGVCIAEALHYAHERGLVHLDLKPSNVLLAADGQPLLLDFHLAREPLGPGQPAPEWFGGTPGYMSPEQGEAVAAMKKGQPLHVRVDGRSDLYSLGVVLYQALGGTASDEGVPAPLHRSLRELRARNPEVSAGWADILKRCLALDPAQRYANGAALADDLRRHLADLPLKGVPNRSLRERWHKWQRRSPRALLVGFLFLLLAGLAVGAGTYFLGEARRRLAEANAALEEGRQQLQAGDPARALDTLGRGKTLAEGAPGGGKLRLALEKQQRQAEHTLTAQQLHALVHRLGFALASDSLTPAQMRGLEKQCGALWQQRQRILQRGAAGPGPELDQELRNDLLDLAAIWTDLRVRLAPPKESQAMRREALQLLEEAEALLGPSPVLEQERRLHAQALGLKETAQAVEPPRTVWARHALARSLLGAGRYEEAAAHLEQVREREPQRFWPNFYWGVCAYRLGRHKEAVHAFSICIALSPASAECYYNRGQAHGAQGQTAQALRDYSRALELDANLAAAACNRGLIHYRSGRTSQAEADFSYALARGFETAALHYNLALAQWSRKDRDDALSSLRRALRLNPEHEEARALLRTLTGQPDGKIPDR
jgi:tetratricopeptide (TPR) repeat protein